MSICRVRCTCSKYTISLKFLKLRFVSSVHPFHISVLVILLLRHTSHTVRPDISSPGPTLGTKLWELRKDKNIELRWNGYNESGQDIEPSTVSVTSHSSLICYSLHLRYKNTNTTSSIEPIVMSFICVCNTSFSWQ